MPISSSGLPQIIDISHNLIASPISPQISSIKEFTDNFTVQSYESGNYFYTLSNNKHFTSGTIVRVYAQLADGRHTETTQVVLDKTPPAADVETYCTEKGENTPTLNNFVKNVTNTNPIAQTFSYSYNTENLKAIVDGYMKIIGEHTIKVDVTDEGHNSKIFTSKLVIYEASQLIKGTNIIAEYDEIKNFSEVGLKQYILANCSPNAYYLSNGKNMT